MADLNSSLESSGVSAEERSSTSAAAAHSSTPSSCETMLWEGWTPNSTADEASTTLTQLPELAMSSSSRLSFHHQSDMLTTMLSHFHPLTAPHTESDDQSTFFQESAESEATVSFASNSTTRTHNIHGFPSSKRELDLTSHNFLFPKSHPTSPLQMWHSLGTDSSSLHHSPKWSDSGHGPTWPGATTSATMQLLQDVVAENSHDERGKELELLSLTDRHHHFHSEDRRVLVPNVHIETHVHNHNVSGVHPTSAWSAASPEVVMDQSGFSRASTRSQQFMNFVRIAQEQRSVEDDPDLIVPGYGEYMNQGKTGSTGSKSGKHRASPDQPESPGPSPKRPHLQAPVDHGAGLWRNAHGHRSLNYSPSAGSQAMDLFAFGPALNTNGKPRARRGSATDPQSVYARHRREKINERLKTLQHLVPNGAKVDIVTMLDEAVHYVQFLQLQVKLLQSDKYWIHATPNTYKGIDLTSPPAQTQGSLALKDLMA